MTVLGRFEHFQVAGSPDAPAQAAGAAPAARPAVQDLRHFLPFMRIVSVRFFMTVAQLEQLVMDLPDSPDASQPNLLRCGTRRQRLFGSLLMFRSLPDGPQVPALMMPMSSTVS